MLSEVWHLLTERCFLRTNNFFSFQISSPISQIPKSRPKYDLLLPFKCFNKQPGPTLFPCLSDGGLIGGVRRLKSWRAIDRIIIFSLVSSLETEGHTTFMNTIKSAFPGKTNDIQI